MAEELVVTSPEYCMYAHSLVSDISRDIVFAFHILQRLHQTTSTFSYECMLITSVKRQHHRSYGAGMTSSYG